MPRRGEVRAGVDILLEESFRPIAGKRVALATNATGRSRDGRSTAQVLTSDAAKKAGVDLVRLFSPEHGIGSDRDVAVPGGSDPATGLPVVSLFGERKRPSTEDLSGIDALVIDIQDVGTRFYTYVATEGYLLEAAARAGIPVVVLDRPDPIGGLEVEGPLADPDALPFTAYAPIPVRYGMTPGELLSFFDRDREIGARLEVVRLRGWSRDLWYDETGLEWVNPSPNMRSVTAAALYPGIGLLETTNLSVGRGTEAPFEWIGAPWLDGARLARVLAARHLPGVAFAPVHFTPASSVFAGERCGGVRFAVTDRQALEPVRLGIEVAVALRELCPAAWDRSKLGVLLANRAALDLLESGATADRVMASWQKELAGFRERRRAFLLY